MSFQSSRGAATSSDDPGRTEAFEAMVRAYAGLVRSAVASVGGRRVTEMAEDVEQRVFLQLWRQIENEQDIRHPASYLCTAAVRETVRLLKRELAIEDRHAEVSVQPAAPTADPHTALEASELHRSIADAIDTLSPRRRRAIRAHLAGYGVREIMGLYGWSYNKARNLIARGKADLRQTLIDRGIHGES
ncbi:MAG: sigma-70 family RNA polymerase sigma factor [bacterium]|nr:sigma-70 family RNA polymerase sigma factor [bacterium]